MAPMMQNIAATENHDPDARETPLFEWTVVDALFQLPYRLTPTTWAGHIPFLFSLIRIDRPRTFVELGVWKGASFIAGCTAAARYETDTQCFGVDTWQVDAHAGEGGETLYRSLAAMLAEFYPSARLLRGRFDDHVDKFRDGSIDLLHIDGDHTFGAAKHDFETWLPKMSDRGIILFHDTCVRECGFGVWALWEELRDRYPSLEFYHSFGLGVLLVGQNLAPLTKRLFDLWKENRSFREFFRCACEHAGAILPARYQAQVNEGLLRDLSEQLNRERAQSNSLNTQLVQVQGKLENTERAYRRELDARIDFEARWRHIDRYGAGNENFVRDLGEQAEQIRGSGLFDADFYLQQNPELTDTEIDPVLHYLQQGYRQGRWPNPLFDTRWYLVNYPEVLENAENPLGHYIANWRSRRFDPNRLFSVKWYLENYPDVAAGGVEPIAHYLSHGARELRDPGPQFSTAAYEQDHRCFEKGINPLSHGLMQDHKLG
jgi:Methyltransferase domain